MKDVLKNKFTVDGKNFNYKWEKGGFHYPENHFPLARMKDSFQNYFSTRRAKTITGRNIWKIDKETYPLAGKYINAFKNMFAL